MIARTMLSSPAAYITMLTSRSRPNARPHCTPSTLLTATIGGTNARICRTGIACSNPGPSRIWTRIGAAAKRKTPIAQPPSVVLRLHDKDDGDQRENPRCGVAARHDPQPLQSLEIPRRTRGDGQCPQHGRPEQVLVAMDSRHDNGDRHDQDDGEKGQH